MSIRDTSRCLIAIFLAGCAASYPVRTSREFLQQGNFTQAFHAINDARQAQIDAHEEVDAKTEECYQEVRIRFLLYEARQAIFDGDERKAVRLIAEVQLTSPNNAVAKELAQRAKHRVASQLCLKGEEFISIGDLAQALECFELALIGEPDMEVALAGRVLAQSDVAKLHGIAQRQFLEAIRKLPEFRYNEAGYHAGVAVLRGASRTDAQDVRVRAYRAVAEVEQQRAEESRNNGAYGAALMSYREALRLWPELPNGEANIVAMTHELEAQASLERASMAIRTGQMEKARALLQAALLLSTLERGPINELLFEARKHEGQQNYDIARDLEIEGKKSEALVQFELVSKDWPDGLADEKTRIGALRNDIQGAEKAFAEGESAEQKNDLKAALEHYRAAQTYYSAYKDVTVRVARLAAVSRSGS